MFGLEKKKTKKKIVEKVSSGAKKKVSKKIAKKTIQKIRVNPHREGTLREKTSVQVVKKGALKVGSKYFDSPQEVSAYYKSEGERVKKAMKQFKVDQAEGYLSVSKTNLMKVLSQKSKLGEIAKDLEEHKLVLNNKIVGLESQKEKGEVHKRQVMKFVNKMKSLEIESKNLLDTKKELIYREAELISEMRKMAKLAQRDLDLTDVVTAKELADFEVSKESVLVKSKELLSEEMNKLFADNVLLDRLDEKSVKRISELNNQLAQIHGAKKETLKKRHILEISEKETEDALAQAETKVKKLEEKYQILLKK